MQFVLKTAVVILVGRTTGIEPASAGATTQCLNHLATLALNLNVGVTIL